jgi:hypothetical protein
MSFHHRKATRTMSNRANSGLRVAAAGLALALAVHATEAQSQMDASTQRAVNKINQSIAQDKANSQNILNTYIRQNSGWLRQQYVASGASRSMSFNQFAYNKLMANAPPPPNNNALANAQRLHQAQVDRFNAMQNASKTQRDAGEALIQNNQQNSDRRIDAVDRSTQGSIRGNTAYVDPRSGTTQWMPTNAPGQIQVRGGETYVQDRYGNYYQRQGSSWVPVQPAGR